MCKWRCDLSEARWRPVKRTGEKYCVSTLYPPPAPPARSHTHTCSWIVNCRRLEIPWSLLCEHELHNPAWEWQGKARAGWNGNQRAPLWSRSPPPLPVDTCLLCILLEHVHTEMGLIHITHFWSTQTDALFSFLSEKVRFIAIGQLAALIDFLTKQL